MKEIKASRSTSWSDQCESGVDSVAASIPDLSLDNGQQSDGYEKHLESILDPAMTAQYDYYKKIYADIFYRWKLIENRALILKTVQSEKEDYSFIAPFQADCCGQLCTELVCGQCQRISLRCIICSLPVRGSANHCLKCGHGGHSNHMRQWFKTEKHCPSGCGCNCLET